MRDTETFYLSPEDLYQRLKHIRIGGTVCHYSLKKCEELVVLINEINLLKQQKNAVILAHSYVSPEINYGVSDFTGDSLFLSCKAMRTQARIIVFAAVRFMGETAKILNPSKTVLIPAKSAGCSLADSITETQVRTLRKEFPDHTFVCYVNTSLAVKAECDVCVTSANVYEVVANIPNDKIYFLPDRYMGENLREEMHKRGFDKDIQFFNGRCHVHENFSPEMVFKVRTEYPHAKVLSHPECTPRVCRSSDFVGSTSQMLAYMQESKSEEFLMLTECGLAARLEAEYPGKRVVGSCALCEYMKSNTLEDILRVLKEPRITDEVVINEDLRLRALRCIEKMFEYSGN
ncbi:MAG: quinolinate synthase NadA [Candidatus Omnitrophica bacterium]|nr:quinolinate synthase NadA [Candidatus Omnitrophota bacterium]MDE2009847.1 quinolinate synthase NadA [Candidatus Omnitrophota bacterium]MDE2214371.1 quinolinate synthase NadA [Candidatus Omnitrophota bacterium]MDE2231120.1 quinolinate synthase NadA [Candidatus Omnitrophota bacterium]